MSDAAVRVIGDRATNAELMLDCRTLGYLADERRTLDLTYGLGRFWKQWRPLGLWTNDIDQRRHADWRVDWSQPDAHLVVLSLGTWDDIVFDPPYKLNGAAGSHASDDSYGVAAIATESERMDAIRRGLTCALRCANGNVLVKVQDQVVSGRKVWQTDRVSRWAEDLGAVKIDQLHVRSYRAQPPGRRQVHARQDYSTLLVFDASGVAP